MFLFHRNPTQRSRGALVLVRFMSYHACMRTRKSSAHVLHQNWPSSGGMGLLWAEMKVGFRLTDRQKKRENRKRESGPRTVKEGGSGKGDCPFSHGSPPPLLLFLPIEHVINSDAIIDSPPFPFPSSLHLDACPDCAGERERRKRRTRWKWGRRLPPPQLRRFRPHSTWYPT